jgi:cytochrome P450 family 33
LVAYPDVQSKLHEELDQIIGENRQIRMDDRIKLPFLNAVILEAQRCGNVVVQNVLRLLTRDIALKDGRVLKRGTYICPQISAMLYDSKRFPNPEEFRVERFLDENGQIKRADDMVAFSLGRRCCPGEGLAKSELFLFTANILNKFRVSLDIT